MTRAALLAAVAARPGDDVPRVVFADWCDENGEADRAEFVRCQVELARHEGDRAASGKFGWRTLKIRSRVEHLRRRERELLAADWHWSEWGPPRGFFGNLAVRNLGQHERRSDSPIEIEFRRGFPATLTLPLAALLAAPARVGGVVGLTNIVATGPRPYFQPSPYLDVMAPPVEWDCMWQEAGRELRMSQREVMPWALPPELYARLPAKYFAFADFDDAVTPEDAAMGALGVAALDHCRAAAGLAPLTEYLT